MYVITFSQTSYKNDELSLLKLKYRKEKSLIVLGKPEIDTNETMGNLSVHSHMSATE